MVGSLRSFRGWIIALIGSVLLNVSLFGLMPGLIQQAPDLPDVPEDMKQIQVIRVKRAPAPPPRKAPEKIEKPNPVKKRDIAQTKPPKPIDRKFLNLKPKLAFQLNPKLPAAPMDLVMPSLEHFSMDAPVLKGQYSMGELDSPLTPLVRIPPLYPIRAKRREIEGFVTVEFLVTKQGRVEQIRIIEANPETIFIKSVMTCVSQWKFKSGTVDGVPVNTLARTTIRFNLDK